MKDILKFQTDLINQICRGSADSPSAEVYLLNFLVAEIYCVAAAVAQKIQQCAGSHQASLNDVFR